MKQEIGGQPLWLWLAGAGVVILGYWYFSHKAGSSGSSSSAPPMQKSSSSENLKETITNFQSSPKPTKKKKAAT